MGPRRYSSAAATPGPPDQLRGPPCLLPYRTELTRTTGAASSCVAFGRGPISLLRQRRGGRKLAAQPACHAPGLRSGEPCWQWACSLDHRCEGLPRRPRSSAYHTRCPRGKGGRFELAVQYDQMACARARIRSKSVMHDPSFRAPHTLTPRRPRVSGLVLADCQEGGVAQLVWRPSPDSCGPSARATGGQLRPPRLRARAGAGVE